MVVSHGDCFLTYGKKEGSLIKEVPLSLDAYTLTLKILKGRNLIHEHKVFV
jgi:hypothetical protein